MSRHERELTSAEERQAARARPESSRALRRGDAGRLEPAGVAWLPRSLRALGNSALSRLLGRPRGGRPLDPRTRTTMERSLGADFGEVRVHDDVEARLAAGALDAAAFTRGEDVYLGSVAPPETVEGQALLAHELVHVVQQRRAATVEADGLSQSTDGSEQAADQIAARAVTGLAGEVPDAGRPPAIQRQRREQGVSRAEAQAALEGFLRREHTRQGGRTLQITANVRTAIQRMFAGDVGALLRIDGLLTSPMLPRDPADLAQAVARHLPEMVQAGRVAHLGRAPAEPPTSVPGRVADLVERTAPGEPERRDEPTGPTPQQRDEQVGGVLRQIRGEEEPTEIGPGSVDVLHAARILRGLPEAVRGPRPAAGPQARQFPAVEQAIQQVATDALVPAEARGRPEADSYADARVLAGDLAGRLDVAQQRGHSSVELRLGANYDRVRDRAAIYAEVERIVRLIQGALPHHAAVVGEVNLFVGARLVRRIMLRGGGGGG